MSDDVEAQIARANARLRRQAIVFGGGGTLVVIGIALAIWLWPTASRDLEAAQPAIAAQRAQYCAIWERVKAVPEGADDLHGAGERVVLPGYVWLDAGDISHPFAGANADEIEASALSALCDDSDRATRWSGLFAGVLEDLAVDPDSPQIDDYDRAGVGLAVSMLDHFEYLVVFDAAHYADSSVGADGALNPGSLAGTLHVFRIESAERIGSMPVRIDAPSTAYVWVTQGAYGEPAHRDVDLAVSADARLFFRGVIARYAAERGLTLVVEDPS